MAAWISAAATSNTDVFAGFFWVFSYMLVVGIGLFVWGATTPPISPSERTLHRRSGAAKYWTVVPEELALGVAFFFLFLAFVDK
jgi:hypothetical protein